MTCCPTSICLSVHLQTKVNLFADIDECLESSNVCENGHCINTLGGFECECDTGYEPTMMNQMCSGRDETNTCSTDTFPIKLFSAISKHCQ